MDPMTPIHKYRFLEDVPLSRVILGRFVDKLGQIYTMSKLVLNGVAHIFGNPESDGYVTMSSSGSEINFFAPVDRFDFQELSTKTLGEFGEIILSEAHAAPIIGWDNFVSGMNTNITAGVTYFDLLNQITEVGGAFFLAKPSVLESPELADGTIDDELIEWAVQNGYIHTTTLGSFTPVTTFYDFINQVYSETQNAWNDSASDYYINGSYYIILAIVQDRKLSAAITFKFSEQ